jgi:hypothetical protein
MVEMVAVERTADCRSCITRRLRVIPWKLRDTACCTARLYNLVKVDEFRLRTLA